MFSHDRPSSAKPSDPNYIGPRRASFSEQVIQRVSDYIKPPRASSSFDQDQDAAGPNLNPRPGPRRVSFSEGAQRVFHHGLSDQDRVGRDRNGGTLRKRYSDGGASFPRRPPGVPSVPGEVGMAGIRPSSMRQRTHSILRPSTDYSPGVSTSTTPRSPLNPNRHVSQTPSQASLHTGLRPRSSREETGCESEIHEPRSENGYSNKKEKRATQRLERERKEFEKRLKKLEKAERKEFEQRMKELRAVEMKEFDASMKREEEEAKAEQLSNNHRPDETNYTATTEKRTPRRLTKKQPLTATNRPSSGDTNTSLSAFSSFFSSRPFSSRPSSRSSSKTRRERSSERSSVDGNASESESYRPLSLNLQEPFGTAISTELAVRKNALLPVRNTPTQKPPPKLASTQLIKEDYAARGHDRMMNGHDKTLTVGPASTQLIKENYAAGVHGRINGHDRTPAVGRKKSFGPSLKQERMNYSKPPRPQAFGQAISTEFAMRKNGLLDMTPAKSSTTSTTPKSIPCFSPSGAVAPRSGGDGSDEEYLTAEEEV